MSRGVALVIVLAAGLWQCSDEMTASRPGALQLRVHRPPGTGLAGARIDTIDVEVLSDGDPVARDTVTVDSSGAFQVLLALDAGGPYSVRVFAWGEGAERWPDSSATRGVVAVGYDQGIEVPAGRLAEVRIELGSAYPSIRGVEGGPGSRRIRAWWDVVPGASGYVLAWYASRTGSVTIGPALPDTEFTQAWGEWVASGAFVAESDSVCFRARADLQGRPGVYGPGRWWDLSLWMDLPRLISLEPGPDDTVAAEGLAPVLVFDRPMNVATLDSGVTWTRMADGSQVTFQTAAGGSAESYVLRPDAGQVTMGRRYALRVTSEVRDLENRPFDADARREGLQDTLVAFSTIPYAPLHVRSMRPEPGEAGVALTDTVHLEFNRAVARATITGNTVYVTDPHGTALSGALKVDPSSERVDWRPLQPYWFATTYTMHVTSGVTDLAGDSLDQNDESYPPEREPFEQSFTTMAQPAGPWVAAAVPAAGERAVALQAAVQIEFSEPVDTLSVRPVDSFRVLRKSGVGIPGSITHDAALRVFTFRPSSPLTAGDWYEVRVLGRLAGDRDGVIDLEGNPLDQDVAQPGYQPYDKWFRAEWPPSVTRVDFDPARADTFVDISSHVRITFSHAVDPATLGAAHLRVSGGAAVPAAISLAPDSLRAEIAPMDPLTYLTLYRLQVDTLLAGGEGSRLDQDPAAAGRQPWRSHFTTEPESLHPAVDYVRPDLGDTMVAVTDTIRIGFTRAVDPATLSTASFCVTRLTGSGAPQAVTGSVHGEARTAYFAPADSLQYATDYEVTVSTAVTDPSGLLPLDQDPATDGLQSFRSQFRTAQERIAPRVQRCDPDSGATGVPITLPVVVTFSEPMDSASVRAAFALTDTGAPVPGSLSADAVARVWTFTPAEPWIWGHSYHVAVDTLARDLHANYLDQDSRTTRREAFAADFETEIEGSVPRVLTIYPPSSAPSVPVTVELRITFSEALALASLHAGAVQVSAAGEPVAGELTLDEEGILLRWVPVELPDSARSVLDFATTYDVRVDTTLADLWGNLLDQRPDDPGRQAYTSFFTTQAETLSPSVTVLLPGATEVPIDAHPSLVFTEPMDAASLAASGVVRLARGGHLEPFTLQLSASADTLTLLPAQPLWPSSGYTLSVDTLATDLVGNGLDQDPVTSRRQKYQGYFTTEADAEPPRVTTSTPADGATHVRPETDVELRFSERIEPSTVSSANVYLVGPEGLVPLQTEPELDPTWTRVRLTPALALEEGSAYGVVATHLVTDLARNALDQDPDDPGAQGFDGAFTIGRRPVIVWSGGVCAAGDSAGVSMDASSAYDPDAGDSIAVAIWVWGDGACDTLAAPAGLIGRHTYACQDIAGCDGLDNDGDASVDEADSAGCDESHRIILEVRDAHGFSRVDTAGVAFCAFLVRGSDPGTGGYAGDSLHVEFTRPVAAASLTGAIEFEHVPEGESVPFAHTLSPAGYTVTVVATGPLHVGLYRVAFTPAITDTSGVPLDQVPCAAGAQPFELFLRGEDKPVEEIPDAPIFDTPPLRGGER